MDVFEFLRHILTVGFGFLDNVFTLIGNFIDSAAAFIQAPITLNASLTAAFFPLQSYAFYGIFTVALIAFGFLVARVVVNLL